MSITMETAKEASLAHLTMNLSKFFELDAWDELDMTNMSSLYENASREQDQVRNLVITVAYLVIFVISLFSNLMVCYIIYVNRSLHTFTNYFIANLSVSDLLMTLINIPFGVSRLLLEHWPFGDFLCKTLPFIQATSVYVSALTMCIISIDRYCAVLHPLGPRITESVPLLLVLLIIWLLSCALSVPFAYYNQVSEIDLVVRQVVRCRANFPSAQYDKMLTILAVSTQYAIPLAIASIAYCSIAFHIKQRSKLGSMTQNQLERISKTNRQTIIMLVLVLIVFAICWLPWHLFYIYRDFVNLKYHNMKIFLMVHWLAMSSICYNPFIYSARNKHFRSGMKQLFRYFSFGRRRSEALYVNNTNVTTHNTTQMTNFVSWRMASMRATN